MRCVIGIDTGGTKCDALVVREDGVAIGWGHIGFRDPHAGRGRRGSGRSEESLRYAAYQALRGVSCEELHITCLGQVVPLGFWRVVNTERVLLHPAAEYSAAFTLEGEDCGIVALSGTGAFVHGRTRAGRVMHLDGLGPHLGDFGSGYHIGHLAIQAAARSDWHPRHRTVLAGLVRDAIRRLPLPPIEALSFIHFMSGDRDRAELASLSPLVAQAAASGDQVAQHILSQAADALAETVRDVVEGLGMGDEDYALVGTGGVIANLDAFWENFCASVARFAPRLRPIRSSLPAVAGVVLRTLFTLDGVDHETLRNNLVRTTRELLERHDDKEPFSHDPH